MLGMITKVDKNTLGPAPRAHDDVRFAPPYPCHFDAATGTWIAELAHTSLTFPRKPAWLESIDRMNAIVLASSEPRALRVLYDRLHEVAGRPQHPGSTTPDPAAVRAELATESRLGLLRDLRALVAIRLADESESTARGGAMAGSLCAEVARYGAMLDAVDRRTAALHRDGDGDRLAR